MLLFNKKWRHIYPDGVRIQFIIGHKTKKAKGRRNRNIYSVTNRKISDAPEIYTILVNVKDSMENMS